MLYEQAKYGSGAAKTLLEKYGKGGKDGNVSISACEKAEEFTGLFPENMKQDAENLYNLIKELNTAVNIGSDKEGGWDYSITGNTGAVWTDDCESARLSKAIELAKAVWPHIYGLQDELTPEVEDKDVTVRKADLGRDIRSWRKAGRT